MHFPSQICIWKCSLRNGGNFHDLNVLNIGFWKPWCIPMFDATIDYWWTTLWEVHCCCFQVDILIGCFVDRVDLRLITYINIDKCNIHTRGFATSRKGDSEVFRNINARLLGQLAYASLLNVSCVTDEIKMSRFHICLIRDIERFVKDNGYKLHIWFTRALL